MCHPFFSWVMSTCLLKLRYRSERTRISTFATQHNMTTMSNRYVVDAETIFNRFNVNICQCNIQKPEANNHLSWHWTIIWYTSTVFFFICPSILLCESSFALPESPRNHTTTLIIGFNGIPKFDKNLSLPARYKSYNVIIYTFDSIFFFLSYCRRCLFFCRSREKNWSQALGMLQRTPVTEF